MGGKTFIIYQAITICCLVSISYCHEQRLLDRIRKRQIHGSDNEGDDCITPDNVDGQCVPILDCEPLYSLLENRERTAEEDSFLKYSQCGFEDDLPKVCCVLQSSSSPRPNTDTAKAKPGPANAATTSRPTVKPTAVAASHGTDERGLPKDCGKAGRIIDRIEGGRPALPRDWPWMALIGFNSFTRPKWDCGGSLVTSRYVVTAAHCIINKKLTIVRLGDLDWNTTTDNAKHVDIPVERAFMHPQYNEKRRLSDIGLIRLRHEVTFNDDIKPICLPVSDSLRSRSLVGMSPFIAGWGLLRFKAPDQSKLYEAQVDIKSNQECAKDFSDMPAVTIDNSVLCAGSPQKDACSGDSGGPLMIPQNDRYVLYGVVSYGIGCAHPKYPGVYARVTEFVDWIESNVVS